MQPLCISTDLSKLDIQLVIYDSTVRQVKLTGDAQQFFQITGKLQVPWLLKVCGTTMDPLLVFGQDHSTEPLIDPAEPF